ncbi:MAG: FtsX-like permease family protein [Lysobacterales bacterium]
MNSLRLQLRASRRYFAAHPVQLALALLGLALGVAAVVSVGAARATISESFKRFSGTLSGAASHHIVASAGFIPGETFVDLRREFADIAMAPVLTFGVQDLEGRRLTVMGVDLLRETQVRSFTGGYMGRDSFNLGEWIGGEALALAAQPISSRLLLKARDNGRPVELLVADELDPALVSGAENLLVMDLSRATQTLHQAEVDRTSAAARSIALPLSRIDLALDDADDIRLEALKNRLGPGLAVKDAGAGDTTGMSRALELNLLALSLLALMVGAFIVFNTLRFFVLQRQQTYAFCRMLGVTRKEIVRWVILEAGVLGLVGTVLGLLLGLWLADLVMSQMAGTVNQRYYEAVSRSAQISPTLWVQAVVLGLVGSLAAALWPAIWAGTVSPLADTAKDASNKMIKVLPLVGIAALIAAAAVQLHASLVSALAGVFLVAVGWIALAIPLAMGSVGKIPLPVARFPLTGFARSRLPQTLSRTSAALAALIVAVATVIGVDHMISSFRGSVVGWLDVTLSADAYLRNGENNDPISDRVVQTVANTQGVAEVGQAISRYWPDAPGIQRLSAQALSTAGRNSYQLLDPWSESQWQRWESTPLALISEPLARRLKLKAGDVVQLPGPVLGKPDVALTVGAVFADYRADGGRAVIHLRQYQRLWNDPTVTTLALHLEPGPETLADDTVQRLRERLALVPNAEAVEIVQTGNLRRRSLEVFDQTFRLTLGLKWLAAIVAFVGVLSAVLALQLERQRESTLLYSMGLTRTQIGRLLLLESLGLGLAAALLAMPLGAALAWLLTSVVNTRAFGWTLYVDWHWPTFVQGCAIATGAALLAAIPPALMFNRPKSRQPG